MNNSLDYFRLKDWRRFLIIAWLDERNQNMILNYSIFLRLWNSETNQRTWEWMWNSEWNSLIRLQARVSLHWQASWTQLGGAPIWAPEARSEASLVTLKKALTSAWRLFSLVQLGEYCMPQGHNILKGLYISAYILAFHLLPVYLLCGKNF